MADATQLTLHRSELCLCFLPAPSLLPNIGIMHSCCFGSRFRAVLPPPWLALLPLFRGRQFQAEGWRPTSSCRAGLVKMVWRWTHPAGCHVPGRSGSACDSELFVRLLRQDPHLQCVVEVDGDDSNINFDINRCAAQRVVPLSHVFD